MMTQTTKALEHRPLVVPRLSRAVATHAYTHAGVERRVALTGLVSLPAMLLLNSPAHADYGEGANIFGKATNTSGFIPYTGEGFAMLLPSKYQPSKEEDFKGVQLRYEDNYYPVNTLMVLKMPSDKRSIDQYGALEDFLPKLQNIGLFGKQAYNAQSKSEGGFAEGRYAAGSLLEAEDLKDKKGRKYYQYQVLVRAADGNEGGRHHIVKATVGSDGNLYVLRAQAGDKRWAKGARKDIMGAVESFIVA